MRDSLMMWEGEACEQRACEIEKEVLGMLRSILGLEVGMGLAHLAWGRVERPADFGCWGLQHRPQGFALGLWTRES